MNDFIPKKKIPVELIDESFDAATTGVDVWYADKREAHHGVIVPLPVDKDGKRCANAFSSRKTVGKESRESIGQFIIARDLNPADYLFPSGNYWGDYYCYMDVSEDITKLVVEEFVAEKVRAICTPRT